MTHCCSIVHVDSLQSDNIFTTSVWPIDQQPRKASLQINTLNASLREYTENYADFAL